MNYEQLLTNALQNEGADGAIAGLVNSIFTQESSRGKNTKTSNQGAMGPMQMVPSTFKGYADKGWDINNPEHNLRAGIRYVMDLNRQFKGDPGATAAAYYGGPKAGRAFLRGESYKDLKNPNAPDTIQYAQKVVSRLGDVVANVPVKAPVNPRSDSVTLVNNVPVKLPIAGITKPLSDTTHSNALAEQVKRFEEHKAMVNAQVPREYVPLGLGPASAADGVMNLPRPEVNRGGTHPLWDMFMNPGAGKAGFDWFKA